MPISAPPPDLGGPDWMAIDQGLACRPSRPMGVVDRVLAIQFRPIMAALARVRPAPVTGAVLGPAHPPKIDNQDPGPTKWRADRTGRSGWQRADLSGTGHRPILVCR